MRNAAIAGSKAAIVMALAVSVGGQVFVIPALAQEMAAIYPEASSLRIPGILGCVAIVACAQVALVCVWRLLSMVRCDSIFRASTFATVNILIGSFAAATCLAALALGVLAAANAMQPGVLILLFSGCVAGLGATLVLVVMRGLLLKATQLERDLAEVI